MARDFSQVAPDELIEKTAKALQANGMMVHLVDGLEAARKEVAMIIPEGAGVFPMTSVTLEETGIARDINESGRYTSVRNRLNEIGGDESKRAEKRQIGAAPEYAIGSVHALTAEGHAIIASNTGSQLPAYAYGAERVVWVVGAQKIVEDFAEGMRRIEEYTLPLEDKRAQAAYGVGSNISKLLVVRKEVNPERIHIVIVKEAVGY